MMPFDNVVENVKIQWIYTDTGSVGFPLEFNFIPAALCMHGPPRNREDTTYI